MAPEIRARGLNRATDRPSQIRNLLTPKEQDALREIATVVEYHRCGHPIFLQDEDADFAYAIDRGVVRIVRHARNGQRQILAFMIPGDLFGLPEDGIYPNTAEVVSAVRLYRFPWQGLVQRMMEEPQLQLCLLVRVTYDLHQAQRRIMILGQQNTTLRLASLLLDFLRHADFYNERDRYLHLPVNRFDLADYLGSARETVGRAITKLERDGFVRRIDSKTIQILDIAGLRAMQPAGRLSLSTAPESSLKVV